MNDPKYTVLEALHRESSCNRATLAKSTECGCFYCKNIYDPVEIVEWCDSGDTAICPYCTTNSVIGNDTIDICAEMLEDMHDYYFSGIQFEAEEKTSFNEYIENYFPISEWETLPSDRYQKQMRSLMKNNTVKEVGAGIEKQKLGLSQSASPTERLMLAICAPDGQKQQVKSEDDLQKDLENLVLVTEICNGETSLDQQTAETLNASAWAMLLKKKPEYVKMCDTGKMSTADLMSILIQTPTIAKHLDVSRLTSKEWKQLVKNQVKLRPLAVKYQINQAS